MPDTSPMLAGFRREDLHFGKARKWVSSLARFGFATKGAVYLLIGLLAVAAAAGAGGSTESSKGAISALGRQTLGAVVFLAAAAGMVCYSLWRFVEAVWDPNEKGTGWKGLGARMGYTVSGLIHLSLAWWAAGVALGAAEGVSDEQSKVDWTAWLMSFPFGAWLVAIAGGIVVGVACMQFIRAWKADFLREYNLFEMSPRGIEWSRRFGQYGLGARGLVFLICGGFLLFAAWWADPGQATGLGGALDTIADQPFGPWLMGITAAGLAAYGLHCFAQARYRYFEIVT